VPVPVPVPFSPKNGRAHVPLARALSALGYFPSIFSSCFGNRDRRPSVAVLLSRLRYVGDELTNVIEMVTMNRGIG
jgi:hypothetical protein